MNWRYVIAHKLFGLFLDSRPRSDKSPVRDVATAIITFIRAMDRMNGMFGFGAIAKASRDFDELASVVETERDGRPCVIFEPSDALADFRFEFWVDHIDGQIDFAVQGDRRYEGFLLTGSLTSEPKDIRSSWPTPLVAASARTDAMSRPPTRYARNLRDTFVKEFGSKDYASMFDQYRR